MIRTIIVILSILASYPVVGASEGFQISARVMETTNKKEVSRFSYKGNINNVFRQQKDFVYKILTNIGIDPAKLPPDVVKHINKLHTTNLKAFVAFSKGIDLRDKGRYQEARLAFKYARMIDPSFNTASRFETSTPKSSSSVSQITQDSMNNAQQHTQQLLLAPESQLSTTTTTNVATNVVDTSALLAEVGINMENPADGLVPDLADIPGLPDGSMPDVGAMPDGSMPDVGAMPDGSMPDVGAMPDGSMPDVGAMPDGSMPDVGAMPDGSMPDVGAMPDVGTMPDTGAMPDTMSSDVGAMPDSGAMPDTNAMSDVGAMPESGAMPDTNTMSDLGDQPSSNNASTDGDLGALISQTSSAVNLMAAVQNNPDQAASLMQTAVKTSGLQANEALLSTLVGMDSPSRSQLGDVLNEAVGNGLSLNDARTVAQSLRKSGVCQ